MDLTPKQIVAELDKYIVGQSQAKKAVAIALRNRYRRSRLNAIEREEITPKNIIMKGPTGVGKTEIARRLAKLVKAPFLKVEATKYTEVGYVGRDVESMIRDLVEVSIRMIKEERQKDVAEKARAHAIERVADALLKKKEQLPEDITKKMLKDELEAGKLDHFPVEIEIADIAKPVEIMPGSGAEINIGSIFGNLIPQKTKKRKINAGEAIKLITEEEAEKLIDKDSVNAEAIYRAENEGIIFIDEIDKIAGKSSHSGPDVSREGVQRDILPIIEGCVVSTKYGNIRTDYILFIASGAFHIAKVEDLIPELQGRFPVLVELRSLTKEDFVKILTEPQHSITEQYAKLLKVDNINLSFTPDGVDAIASVAWELNTTNEDIGARRLQTILEQIIEEVSFDVDGEERTVVIDNNFVEQNLTAQTKGKNLRKYVL